MSKIIETENGFHTKLNHYEKYIKLGKNDIQPFLKFLAAFIIAFFTASISLIRIFQKNIVTIIIISVILFLISIYIYLRFYKKPQNGFGFSIF